MELHSDFEAQCERYLLGELSESDSQKLEASYFDDDSLFERFVAVKEDLLDAYARGTLTGKKREHFEERFLKDESRREAVEDARRLIQLTTAASPGVVAEKTGRKPSDQQLSIWTWLTGRPAFIPATAFATLLIVAFVGWLILRGRSNRIQNSNGPANESVIINSNKKSSSGETATVRETPRVSPSDRTAEKLPSSTPPEVGPTRPQRVNPTGSEKSASRAPAVETVALVLEPYTSRSITPTPTPAPRPSPSTNPSGIGYAALTYYMRRRVILNPTAQTVQLGLVYRYEVEGTVEVTVSDMEGKEIVNLRDLKPVKSTEAEPSVTFTFPASLLKRNDYVVRLSARTKDGTPEIIAEYPFTVVRQPARPPGRPRK